VFEKELLWNRRPEKELLWKRRPEKIAELMFHLLIGY
jgi:hypothetical protein